MTVDNADTASGSTDYAAQAAQEAASDPTPQTLTAPDTAPEDVDPTATGEAMPAPDLATAQVHSRLDSVEHALGSFMDRMESLLSQPAIRETVAQVASIPAPAPLEREPITEDNIEGTIHGILDSLDRIKDRLWPNHTV